MQNGSANGLLGKDKSDYVKMGAAKTNLFFLYSCFTVVLSLGGVGTAVALLFFQKPEAVMTKMQTLASLNLGLLYLSFTFMKYMIVMINANLGTSRRASGCNVPDQHVYKVFGQGHIVLMDDEGDNGKFNRAQRALQNLFEQLPMFLVSFLMVGFVFPWITAGCTVVFGLARFYGAVCYTEDRMKRMKGNMLGGLMHGTLDGISLVIGIHATMAEFS